MESAFIVSKKRLATHPCRSESGFNPSMAGTDDNDVVLLWIYKHTRT